MKKMLVVVMLLAVPLGAQAQRGHYGQDGYPGMAGRGKASLATLRYYLPGAYALLDRLELTEEQEKILVEIAKKHLAERRKASTAAWKSVPRVAGADLKDPEKRKAYYAKTREAYKAARLDPPIDEISNVLTPEQLGRILKADQIIAEWRTWLAEHLAAYDKKLTAAVGPEPEAEPGAYTARYAYYVFENYLKGSSQLARRLGLAKEQGAALAKLRQRPYGARSPFLFALTTPPKDGKLSATRLRSIQTLLSARAWEEKKKETRAKIEELLTGKQRDALAAGVKILEERDAAILKRYTQCVAEVDKILPRPKPSAGAGGLKPVTQAAATGQE